MSTPPPPRSPVAPTSPVQPSPAPSQPPTVAKTPDPETTSDTKLDLGLTIGAAGIAASAALQWVFEVTSFDMPISFLWGSGGDDQPVSLGLALLAMAGAVLAVARQPRRLRWAALPGFGVLVMVALTGNQLWERYGELEFDRVGIGLWVGAAASLLTVIAALRPRPR